MAQRSESFLGDQLSLMASAQQLNMKDDVVTPPRWFLTKLLLRGVGDRSISAEVRRIFSLAAPLVLVSMWLLLVGPISVAFSGHLGAEELAGVALAGSLINVFCLCPAMGLSFGCDTLFSQTFGSGNYKLVGIHMQRSFCVFALFLGPITALLLNLKPILLLMGQTPGVSVIVDEYLLYFLPGTPAMFAFLILLKYMVAQNLVVPVAVIGFLGNLANAALQYLMIYTLNWGPPGSAVAMALSWYIFLTFLFAYIVFTRSHELTWGGWSVQAFSEWGQVAALSVPGLMMLFMGWASFELGIILSGILSEIHLGIMSILLYTEQTVYMLQYGIGDAIGIRVGQLLGAGDALGTVLSIRLAILLTTCVACFTFVLLMATREYIPAIFTSDPTVHAGASVSLIAIALFTFFDVGSATGGGILRGSGRQMYGMVIQFLAFYLAGVPLGICLMFLTNVGVIGHWIGLATAVTIQVSGYLFIVLRTDWHEQSDRAKRRAGLEENESENKSENDSERAHLLSQSSVFSGKPHKFTTKTIISRVIIILLSSAIFIAGILIRVLRDRRASS